MMVDKPHTREASERCGIGTLDLGKTKDDAEFVREL